MPNDTGFQYVFLDPVIDSEETILAIRAAALSAYQAGRQVLEWTGEGNSGKKAFVAPVESILAETRYALKQLNPAVYGYIVRNSRAFRIS